MYPCAPCSLLVAGSKDTSPPDPLHCVGSEGLLFFILSRNFHTKDAVMKLELDWT